jgi:16S rRNA G966 N2-methylase RsmD|tara:strand:- start:19409 stop:20584 length:1176 start_codon:yes stop_codon:yes gene_type:complete
LNPDILNIDVQNFITNNLNTESSKLIFKGSPFSNVSIQEIAEQVVSKNKCRTKLPTWYNTANIYYPNKLNIEQTSSEITAAYKASLVSGNTLIDLTGGFGVDCLSFSHKFKQTVHCEINSRLSKIVHHNLKQLKIKNIRTISEDGTSTLEKSSEKFDWIYIDPSRRNDIKGKVFQLKDCLPNVADNLEIIFKRTNNILIKTSPILDLTLAINELRFVKKVHVVAVNNEVKELLFVLEKNNQLEITIETINFTKNKEHLFSFIYNQDITGTYSLPKRYLYQPNSAILKSGGFQEVSFQLGIPKLHKHSHLYTSDTIQKFPGRKFEIINCIPFDKKQLKKITPNKKANITTRNFPQSVEQIRRKTGIKDGGTQYLFFTRDHNEKLIILNCKKI